MDQGKNVGRLCVIKTSYQHDFQKVAALERAHNL